MKSRHHLIWEKPWYRTEKEREFRTHRGLIKPLYPEAHNLGKLCLHANVQPPAKPTRPMMLGALSLLDSLTEQQLRHPTYTIELMSEYFDDQSMTGDLVADRIAQNVFTNLRAQLPFVADGFYAPRVVIPVSA